MPKKQAAAAKPQTHFEQVPLAVVVKVAEIDASPVPGPVKPPAPRKPSSFGKKP
jgi:hypothetical protein